MLTTSPHRSTPDARAPSRPPPRRGASGSGGGPSAPRVEVRLPGVGPKLLVIGLSVVLASAVVLLGAGDGGAADRRSAPVPAAGEAR